MRVNKGVGELVRACVNMRGLARGCKNMRGSVRPYDSVQGCVSVWENMKEAIINSEIIKYLLYYDFAHVKVELPAK